MGKRRPRRKVFLKRPCRNGNKDWWMRFANYMVSECLLAHPQYVLMIGLGSNREEMGMHMVVSCVKWGQEEERAFDEAKKNIGNQVQAFARPIRFHKAEV